MNDPDDTSSETSDTALRLDDVEHPSPTTPQTILYDFTEEDKFLSDNNSLSSLILKDGIPEIKPRPYQTEMFEESLKRNIIVAMDTGSGKTHIATMRIIHELESIHDDQIIFFLAPTVYLCAQQFEYLQSQISAVEIKFLSGADGVERWTEQSHWDAVLLNVKIVVSTYQILLDALTHGFIQMASLALIVFDEVHNAIDKAPGAVLMRNFYHRNKSLGLNVPHILGLTASPVMRSNTASLGKIEQTMDAICRSPSKHRAELRLQVKLPELRQVYYSKITPCSPVYTDMMVSLGKAYYNLRLEEDPYYLRLLQDKSERGQRMLEKVRLNMKTTSRDQIKSFVNTTKKIWEELGSSAADHYISEVVHKVLALVGQSESSLGIWDITNAEKQYIADALRHIEIGTANVGFNNLLQTTSKVEKMINTLLEVKSGTFSGIIFVQERAVASVLAKLLSVHPRTQRFKVLLIAVATTDFCSIFKVGVMVGTSKYSARVKNIGELIDFEEQKHVLPHFKEGKINLIVATSILEEGIDIPICNLVLCFHKPANLKSFVQRRGRARHRDSRLVLLLSEDDKGNQWQQLEADMRRIYEDEMRTLQELLVQEDTEEEGTRTFHVPTTNALLDLDNAVSHLYHFCSTLPANQYVDLRPEFICSHHAGGLTTAKVILPISVDKTVREAYSQAGWTSEKNAIKDAAFEAYVALYRAGLVNDNLLPLLRHDAITDELRTSAVETRASIVSVNEQLNPWITIAKAWEYLQTTASAELSHATITIKDLNIECYMPIKLPRIPSFAVYWNRDSQLLVAFKPEEAPPTKYMSPKLVDDTWALLHAGFGSRFAIKESLFPVLFGSHLTGSNGIRNKLGHHDAVDHYGSLSDLSNALIRDKNDPNIAYTLDQFVHSKPDARRVQFPGRDYQDQPPGVPYLALNRVPKRNDFLHKVVDDTGTKTKKDFQYVLPLNRCVVGEMPLEYIQFARLIPSIMHRIELSLIAEQLSRTLLHRVCISDTELILTAICASSAREDSNYQRLEFLGDSILKTCTSMQLVSEYPLWHEGYLSAMKDRLVSNSRLSRAAREIGLDRYIITKAFTGNKWRPVFVEDLLSMQESEKTRDMSTKILADVVEALVGAAMVDGDFPKALACLETFLPELEWKPLEERRLFLHQRVPDVQLPVVLQPLETLIGYTFTRKSILVEAMTHASCNSGSGSFERFEFLGDSILDYVVVSAMWPRNLSHFQMHLLRTVLVNADFLAFICMEWSIEHEIIDLETSSTNKSRIQIAEKHTTHPWALWRFMRHLSPKLGAEQVVTATRFEELRDEIKEAIEHGSHYPWTLLSRLQAQKYYSDIIESLLGAVWLDSGSFEVCKEMVHRMGILPYMERILKDDVQVWHPKEELGVLVDDKTVKYVMENSPNAGSEEEESQYTCTIYVDEERIVGLSGNVPKAVLQTMTAEKAVKILKARKAVGGIAGGIGDMDTQNEGPEILAEKQEANFDFDMMEE